MQWFVVADDFRAHTSCVTEVERYEKRAPKKNGKVPPQQLWMDLISSSIPMAPAHLQSYIRTMSTLDNVPRKEKPFYNFTANSLNLKNKHGNGIVAEIWKYLSDCRRKQLSSSKETGDVGESTEAHKSAADSLSESVTNNSNELTTNAAPVVNNDTIKSDKNETVHVQVDKSIVKKKMKLAFKSSNSKSLPIKKLRKIVKEQFSKDDQTSVKQIIKQMIGQGKYFSQDGENITILKK